MSKIEQALILDPPLELHFKAPFTDVTTSYIQLTNPTNRMICFKVKTTAPKTYCVRPNGGFIAPKKSVSVTVMLQPLDLETADKSKHKFMVQSMFVEGMDTSPDELWKSASPDALMNSKLKCVFDIPSDGPQGTSEAFVASSEDIKPVTIKVPEPAKSGSPKPSNSSVDHKIKRTIEENEKLKLEVTELRQENSSLKEEGLRWRVAYDTRSRGTTAEPESDSESRQHSANKQLPMPVLSTFLIAMSVIIFIVGLYLGKHL